MKVLMEFPGRRTLVLETNHVLPTTKALTLSIEQVDSMGGPTTLYVEMNGKEINELIAALSMARRLFEDVEGFLV